MVIGVATIVGCTTVQVAPCGSMGDDTVICGETDTYWTGAWTGGDAWKDTTGTEYCGTAITGWACQTGDGE